MGGCGGSPNTSIQDQDLSVSNINHDLEIANCTQNTDCWLVVNVKQTARMNSRLVGVLLEETQTTEQVTI